MVIDGLWSGCYAITFYGDGNFAIRRISYKETDALRTGEEFIRIDSPNGQFRLSATSRDDVVVTFMDNQ